jgi:GMP synthase (glutamine-hydrolysing)
MEKIIILDFGSQYTQLIARRLRELCVYTEIIPYNKDFELTSDLRGVILSGSPFSVNDENALKPNLDHFMGKLPVLGICYGAQYIADYYGGNVARSDKREYGKATLNVKDKLNPLVKGINIQSQVWMSHGDTIKELPSIFNAICDTDDIPVAAFTSSNPDWEYPVFGVQFHPEVVHSLQGKDILKNFLDISSCQCDWSSESFVQSTITDLKQKIGDDSVLMGLSGGVDSTVGARLLQEAIGDNLICLFLDNGLLRKDEFTEVLQSYKQLNLNVVGVDASHEFLSELEGVSDPEKKRKTIGRVFIEVFEREAKKFANIKWLGQGTIYPDVIESVSVHGPSVTIKSHHNVGGLPEKLNLKIVEPLRMLFKDEVRKAGAVLEIPDNILQRHPFPGPGLAIRILGPIDADKIKLTQEADAIFINNLKKSGWYSKVWQSGAILLPVQSVGVMGDERTYEFTIALRSVNSTDGMTAEWSRLPHDLLADISNEIINNVKGINRVVYDISTKPPATIEWE